MMMINDLPTLSNRNTKILLYADDTSIIVNSSNPYNHQIIIEEIFCNINKCFKDNLSLNLDKTHWLQFNTRKTSVMIYKQPTQISIFYELLTQNS